MVSRLNAYCNATGETSITLKGLTNWRGSLVGEQESLLGHLKSFLLSWYDWDYPGIDKACADYLESLVLKGNVKGKAVKGACPFSGPLSSQEQGAVLDWLANAFTQKSITLEQYAFVLALSFTGRRAVQLRSCRACDISAREDKKGREYTLNVPRVKQKGVGFRETFRAISIVPDLYLVLMNQCQKSQEYVERQLRTKLPQNIKQQIPIFIDRTRIRGLRSVEDLTNELSNRADYLHMTASSALDELADVARRCTARSERTGEFIHLTSRRFRYTKATNLAKRGIQGVELAFALDQTDTQHVSVYTENTPETAAVIDKFMAPALAPLAQAFAGQLIDSERDALRANDPHSRVKNNRSHNVGNCGTHAFCASGYRACYTCVNFQPWLDAPHEEVRDEVLAERERQQEIGISQSVIESSDRLLLAVEQVIQMCREVKEAVGNE
ncbi:hypothetical protein LHL20_18725 [Alteromonas sp. McT4-15]|nr:hypothetical protein [Alteromonas sp. McT4-15]